MFAIRATACDHDRSKQTETCSRLSRQAFVYGWSSIAAISGQG